MTQQLSAQSPGEPPTGLGAVAYVGAISLVLLVWLLVARLARHRQLRRSVEWKTITAIAYQLAFDRRQSEVHAAHFGLALTVDPSARLALEAMGADRATLRRLYESRVAELPSVIEDYRATRATDLALHASSRQLLAQLGKHPAITIRSWLMTALLDRELGPAAKRCGATVAAALKVPEHSAARAGDVVVEGSPDTRERIEAVTDVLADVFALDRVEASAAAIALHCRGSVRFPNGSNVLAEQATSAANEKSAPMRVRYMSGER